MSNIIQLLERMGQDAALQSQNAKAQEILAADVAAEIKNSLLVNDAEALHEQLDICPDVVAFLLPAEDEQKEDENNENEEQEQASAVNQ